mgnify:FL=1
MRAKNIVPTTADVMQYTVLGNDTKTLGRYTTRLIDGLKLGRIEGSAA